MKKPFLAPVFILVILLPVCKTKNTIPSKEAINNIDLKRGGIASCGPLDKQFGSVVFNITGSEEVKKDFNLAVALLHSFEYDEAEKIFAKVIDREPGCAMAYWGIAMSNFHPLWTAPSEKELQKGAKVLALAQSLQTSKREAAYIDAIASFYKDWDKADHHTRCLNFERGMEKIY